MNKFLIVLRKELKELFTIQSLIPLLLIFILFYFMGDLIKGINSDKTISVKSAETAQGDTNNNGETAADAVTEISDSKIVGLIDRDKSELSNKVISALSSVYYFITPNDEDPDAAISGLSDYEINGNKIDISVLMVIPEGFEAVILSGENQSVPVEIYSHIKSFGMMSLSSGANQQALTAAVNSIVSAELFAKNLTDPNANIEFLQYPVYEKDFTVINEVTGEINPSEVIGYIMSQTTFIPVIVYFIIMFATQMVATSVVNEKGDKTLETLMTTPIKRIYVLLAKVLAASIYAVVCSVIYIFAFKNYMGGMGGNQVFSDSLINQLKEFGIAFDIKTFAIIGVQLFLSVLCGLSIALILGIMVDDIKSLQSYIMPVMIVIIIPYILTIFMDINTLSPILQILIYLIPFTHTFTAATNIFAQNYMILAAGVIYQVIFVIIVLTIAIKIFNSDKLITLSEMLKSRKSKKKFSLSKFKR